MGIVSCLGKKGGKMKSATGEMQAVLMFEQERETTHLLVGQGASGPLSGGL